MHGLPASNHEQKLNDSVISQQTMSTLQHSVEFHNMCILASLLQNQLNFPKVKSKNLILTVLRFHFVTFSVSFFTTVPFI